MDVKEAAAKGGRRTAELYGHDHYVKIGRMGGKKTAETHGTEHYVAIGKTARKKPPAENQETLL